MAILKKIALTLLGLVGIGLLLPLGVSLFAHGPGGKEVPGTLVMVFPGAADRIGAGFRLAREGRASMLAISGVGVNGLEARAERFPELEHFVFIGSDRSRSTFEDVYNTWEILQQHRVRSVVLVTSSWHVPRAYFFLRCFLLGSGVQVRVVAVPDARTMAENGAALLFRGKMALNEAIKFWGSSVEMGWVLLTGDLLLDNPRCQQVSGFVKQHFLL